MSRGERSIIHKTHIVGVAAAAFGKAQRVHREDSIADMKQQLVGMDRPHLPTPIVTAMSGTGASDATAATLLDENKCNMLKRIGQRRVKFDVGTAVLVQFNETCFSATVEQKDAERGVKVIYSDDNQAEWIGDSSLA